MKNFFLLFVIFLTSSVHSQESKIVTKITKDSLSIKWLPSDFKGFQAILEGAKISRIEASENSNPSSLDFSTGLIKTIEPAKKRYDKLNSSIEEEDKFITLLSPFYESSNEPEEQNFAFGTAVIENVINPNFQFIVGNIIVDKNFIRGKSYYYKIEIGKQKPIYVFINSSKITQSNTIENFNLLLDLKKTVEATWNYQKIKKDVFGFIIEHSIDDSLHASNLLNEPFLPFKSSFEKEDKLATIRDDSPLQGHFHYYKINGLDAFGHPSVSSTWKKIYVPLLIDAWVQIDTIQAKKEQRIISGHIFTDGRVSHILNIDLLRSTDKDSNYQLIENRAFNDTLPEFKVSGKLSDDHYYYKIIAYNADDTIYSLPYYFFTLDQQPPGAPIEISGIVDSLGIVRLKWLAPNDDDLQGYRVFRGNAKDEDFVEQTVKLSLSTQFFDTIRLDNLSSDIYYFIKAVDDNYNNSISSDTVLLIKPDTIPPVSSILIDVLVKDTSIIISWINSNSEDLKVSKLIKYSSRSLDTIFSWNDTVTRFIDYDIIPGNEYSYSIKTFDKSLNFSETKQLIRFYEPGYRKPLAGVKISVDKLEKGIKLVWNKPNDNIYNYVIYRAKLGEKLLPLKTIEGTAVTEYLDKNIAINNKYVYSIKYVNESGIHSQPINLEIIYQ